VTGLRAFAIYDCLLFGAAGPSRVDLDSSKIGCSMLEISVST